MSTCHRDWCFRFVDAELWSQYLIASMNAKHPNIRDRPNLLPISSKIRFKLRRNQVFKVKVKFLIFLHKSCNLGLKWPINQTLQLTALESEHFPCCQEFDFKIRHALRFNLVSWRSNNMKLSVLTLTSYL